jgi:hypothetical protein
MVAVMVYTLLVGWGLLSGSVPPERTYLLMLLPCLAPAIWNLFGFLRADADDVGLFISGTGWLLAAIALLIQHKAIMEQLAKGVSIASANSSSLATVIGLLAAALILTGAALSWRSFRNRISRSIY